MYAPMGEQPGRGGEEEKRTAFQPTSRLYAPVNEQPEGGGEEEKRRKELHSRIQCPP